MLKLITIVFTFVFIINFANGQGNTNKPDKPTNFRIGVFYSIDKNLSPTIFDQSEYVGYDANYNKTNYKTGLNVEYEVNNNVSLTTGIGYSNKNFTGTLYCDVCDFLGPILPKEINLQYIEIPLTSKYYFLSTQFRLFVQTGFINQVIINSEEAENSYVLSGTLGGGIEYNFTKILSLQLSTEYTKGLSGLYENSIFRSEILGFRLEMIAKL